MKKKTENKYIIKPKEYKKISSNKGKNEPNS